MRVFLVGKILSPVIQLIPLTRNSNLRMFLITKLLLLTNNDNLIDVHPVQDQKMLSALRLLAVLTIKEPHTVIS
jgi:hypothetical protein